MAQSSGPAKGKGKSKKKNEKMQEKSGKPLFKEELSKSVTNAIAGPREESEETKPTVKEHGPASTANVAVSL